MNEADRLTISVSLTSPLAKTYILIVYLIINNCIMYVSVVFHCLHASGDFFCLLITFANSLDRDQAQHFVGPDLDPKCLSP